MDVAFLCPNCDDELVDLFDRNEVTVESLDRLTMYCEYCHTGYFVDIQISKSEND